MIPPQTTTTPLTTPLPTPPITSEALTITTTVHDPLPAVIQRLSNLEKKFESWTKFDHSEAIEASLQANLINEVKNQLLKFLPKTLSDFFNRRLESTIRNVLQKTPALLAQSFSTPGQSSSKAGHLTILADFFFNNDLEYLRAGITERKYTTSLTKPKASRYDLKGIEDMIPNKSSVDKQFGYGHLKEIMVRRDDQKLYKFMEGDFPNLHLNDIEYMLLLHVQNKIFNLEKDIIVDLAATLRMYTRRIVIQKSVEDVQLGVESYQKKLNITKPQQDCANISFKEPYTIQFEPQGVIYEDKQKQKRLMRTDELYKFSDSMLKFVHDTLHERLLNFRLGYNKGMERRKWTEKDQRRSRIMMIKIDE
ncbi:hypothetical protein Tco_0541309 [Tanacetum coccineum]